MLQVYVESEGGKKDVHRLLGGLSHLHVGNGTESSSRKPLLSAQDENLKCKYTRMSHRWLPKSS